MLSCTKLVKKKSITLFSFKLICTANLAFLFLFSGPLFSQKGPHKKPTKRDTSATQHYLEAEISGSYYINSNALTTELVNKFIYGGYISTSVKDRVKRKLAYSDRVGGDVDYGMNVTWKPDSLFHKKNLSVNFSMKDRLHYDAGFSRDFFKVVMYGNKSFAGETADLGNFTLNVLRYQQARISLEWEGDTARGSYGVSASFLKGEKNLAIDADRASLSTSSDGTKIDLDLAMLMRQTDTAHTGIGAFNGYGVSTDFFYEFPYLTWYNEGILRMEVNDLGFMQWNTNSVYYKVDSSYHYDGVSINNILDLKEHTLPSGNPDSIIKNNVKYGTEPYITILPAIFTVNATTYFGKKYIFEKGMRFRMKSNCKPFYYATFSWFPIRQFMISGTVAYGGYGNFNAGMELEYNFPKQFRIHLDSYYLTGYLIPKNCSAQGITLSISKRF